MLFIVPKYDLWFSFPHPGILYVAASVRQAGEKVDLIDGGILSRRELFRLIKEKAPHHDTIALTVSVAHAGSAVEISNFVRKNFPNKKIIWGGPYPSSQHELISESMADIMVSGEGELQASLICRGKPLSEIPSIVYFDEGIRKVNKRESYINDLDALPFPEYDLVNLSNYHHPGLKPVAQIISSRGCPYQCINCTKSVHGSFYRVRSPENVVEEISMLVDSYGAREIHFWDDNLTLNVDRVKEICSLILSKNIQKKARFAVPSGIRADIYDKEMFDLMKRAGFYLFAVAVESGEQQVIDRIGKKLDLSKVPGNLEKLQKHGFRLMLYFMMGFPFEREEDMIKTAKFASSLPGNHVNFFAVTPLPGSELFDIWGETPDFKDYLEVNYDSPVPQARSLEQARMLRRMIRKAYFKFYMNPTRAMSTILLMLREGSLLKDMFFIFKTLLNLSIRGHK
ncbi:MAG TPA: radical SAM protein [Victivallales bacterium]|nr:radical SAM protein [Victivallales bacterium]